MNPVTLLWIAGMIGNILMWIYSYICVRWASTEILAQVNLQSNSLIIISIVAVAWQLSVARWWSHFSWQYWLRISAGTGLAFALIYWVYQMWAGAQTTDLLVLSVVMSILVFFMLSLVRGGMLAQQILIGVGVSILVEGFVKILLAAGIIWWGHFFEMLLLATPLSFLVAWIAGWFMLPDLVGEGRGNPRDFFAFWGNSIGLQISVLLPMSIDLLVLAHYWDLSTLGRYAHLVFWGKSIFFVMYSFIGILVPLLLKRKSEETGKIICVTLLLVLMTGVGGWGFLLMFPSIVRFIVPDFPPELFSYMVWYGVGITSLGIMATISTGTLLQGKSFVTWLSLIMSGLMVVGLLKYHASIEEVTHVIGGVFGVGALASIGLFMIQLRQELFSYASEKKIT